MVSIGARFISVNRTNAAPRLKASIPTAPVPANRSHQFESITSPARILKSDSLARSVMGRVVSPGTDFNLRPLALPAITLRLIGPHSRLHFWPPEYFHVARSRGQHSRWQERIVYHSFAGWHPPLPSGLQPDSRKRVYPASSLRR